MLKERNAAFFSDPSTLHYSKYLNSADLLKQENEDDEDDEFKSYLFVNNLYEEMDAHTISNFQNEYYYQASANNQTTSLQDIRQNSEPIGLLCDDNENNFRSPHSNEVRLR